MDFLPPSEAKGTLEDSVATAGKAESSYFRCRLLSRKKHSKETDEVLLRNNKTEQRERNGSVIVEGRRGTGAAGIPPSLTPPHAQQGKH